ncbi:MAG: hypothetical protein Q7R52_02465 [archaeon]|nr:hypothetical protein [archaeon]
MLTKEQLEENQKRFNEILKEASDLRWKKFQCYGDSYKKFGTFGLAIKINDKSERLCNVIQNNELAKLIKDESLRDTVIDLLNYCVLFIDLLDEEFKELQERVSKIELTKEEKEYLDAKDD